MTITGRKGQTESFNNYSYVLIYTNMDVMIDKKTKTIKLKFITSFLIITFSIILFAYAIINDELMVILFALILIIKIFDITLNFHRMRRKLYKSNI